jgi:16S rRNA (guanine(966)-N(2))-methyltransferase RsmD
MRVISGTAKGRKLAPPKDRRILPTSDRVKEALFSILISQWGTLDGKAVLDLFAGSGNLGIEALSRGANHAVFVDNHRTSVTLVATNLRSTGLTGQAEVIQSDVNQALSRFNDAARKFDLVFADPPYGQGLTGALLDRLGSILILDEGAIVVIESAAGEEFPAITGSLEQTGRRIYGDTALTFFELSH